MNRIDSSRVPWQFFIKLISLRMYMPLNVLCNYRMRGHHLFESRVMKGIVCISPTDAVIVGLCSVPTDCFLFYDPQVWSLFDLIRYSVGVCNQIASHLHINVFKISSISSPVSTLEHNHHE